MSQGVEATNERRPVPRIEPVEPENAPEESRPRMKQAAKSAGQTLNFHRVFAISPKALEGYLNLNSTLNGGALDRQMQESIAVAVSDFNGCDY
jgi:alkylhydroperoxidase family enzyme